jgi:hypothetical protein
MLMHWLPLRWRVLSVPMTRDRLRVGVFINPLRYGVWKRPIGMRANASFSPASQRLTGFQSNKASGYRGFMSGERGAHESEPACRRVHDWRCRSGFS